MTEQPDPRAGSGAIWFWAYGGFLRGDLSDKKDRYVFSFSPIRNRNWNHLCMTWDEEHGQKIYMNAKSLASPGDEHSPLVSGRRFRSSTVCRSKVSSSATITAGSRRTG